VIVQLDPQTFELLRERARSEKVTLGNVLRAAIAAYVADSTCASEPASYA
jgi:hypothetical protein